MDENMITGHQRYYWDRSLKGRFCVRCDIRGKIQQSIIIISKTTLTLPTLRNGHFCQLLWTTFEGTHNLRRMGKKFCQLSFQNKVYIEKVAYHFIPFFPHEIWTLYKQFDTTLFWWLCKFYLVALYIISNLNLN